MVDEVCTEESKKKLKQILNSMRKNMQHKEPSI